MKKFLQFIGILFMGITAALTLLSGVGTSCVALDPSQYETMLGIAPFQWLYILYVLVSVAIGVLGIRATIQLAKGKKNSERSAFIALVAGIAVGVLHMTTSRALRGSSIPLDYIVYFTVLTLIIFLIFRISKVRSLVNFEKEIDNSSGAAGGMVSIVAGMLFLSVQMWAGPTHILNGINYADAFHNAMLFSGSGLILLGIGLIAKAVLFQPNTSVREQTISR